MVNIHHAKTHLSKLIQRVELGEDITIARAGKPVARLVPVKTAVVSRTPGSAKGQVTISANFDAPMPKEFQRHFE
ncbi:MAG TPA: type II toxin-antitoxin system Phd/YefM family antitoxin [bacterium]|nr:type II toxin-antitoxin system Phd/YefM family antitoxin [bacterium]